MIRTIIPKSSTCKFTWVDLVDASREELNEIGDTFDLHPATIADCADDGHPPKFEEIDDVVFIITRVFDESGEEEGTTLKELTRKIAVFLGKDFIVTFHRNEQKYLNSIMEKFKGKDGKGHFTTEQILLEILLKSVYTFETPLLHAEDEIDDVEEELFTDKKIEKTSQEIYLLRRRIGVIKKALWSCMDAFGEIRESFDEKHIPSWQNLIETVKRMHGYADELYDGTSSLLSLQLSLTSHKANLLSHRSSEVMKVLTIFSVFFMPLTFIVGVYGMNFKYMPELDSPYGYYSIWGVMLTVVAAIFIYFKHKGWLRRDKTLG